MKEQGHYILLADDDPDDQEMLAERFIQHYPDVNFLFFMDGAEVLTFLESCADTDLPELLILDYKMPIVTGEEVLKALQGKPRYQGIHKIIWSTSGNNAYINQCMTNGADRYFVKPTNLPQLDNIIAQIAGIYGAKLPGSHP